jgi:glycosyltransferase involved in cell wall biosynthesis
MKVSVVTITQEKRFPVLCLLLKCIHHQTHQPDEWVIVDGSKTKQEADRNEVLIKGLQQDTKIPIVYVPHEEGVKLGGLRNKGNNRCTGDITVVMDDDDYYPPQRIQHVIDMFKKYPDKQVAGCSALFIHDYTTLQFYQCKPFHERHSTNSAMAWKKSYLVDHQHDASKETGEEFSFTNGFTEDMIQLLSGFTVVLSSHTKNTFDKKDLLKNNARFVPLKFNIMPRLMNEQMYRDYLERFRRFDL